jgi:hypothetical protein
VLLVCLKEHSKPLLSVFLRCSLAVGLKRLEQAARGVQRDVYGVEQRQIAQLGTTAKVALRKHISVITMVSIDAGASIPESPGLHAQFSSYKMMKI